MSDYVIDFVGGFNGGCAGVLIGQPFDTLKVRQQALSAHVGKGAFQAVRGTLVHDGVMGLYKGMTFPLLTTGMLNSISFGVYGHTSRNLATYRHGEGARASYLDVFLAGAVGGAAYGVPMSTVELVKVKLQAQTNASITGSAVNSRYQGTASFFPNMYRDHGLHGVFRGIDKKQVHSASLAPEASNLYRGPVHCLASLYRDHGLRGCFRGLHATVLREIPGFSVYMVTYEYLCDIWTPGREKVPRGVARDKVSGVQSWGDSEKPLEEYLPEITIPTELLAGGLAGTASWVGNIPFDVVKNRLQADDLANPRYKSYMDCVIKSYRSDGFRVFWRGLPVTCIRAFPVNAVTFAAYSSTMQWYQRLQRDKKNQD